MAPSSQSQDPLRNALEQLSKRVDELEMRGTFGDHAQQELSDALASESRRINDLQIKVDRLEKQLEALLEGPGGTGPERPPPHY